MPKELMIKTYEAETKVVEDKGKRVLNVTITTNTVDRDGDIVEPKGISLTNFRKNPVVLMAHDYRGLPIARAENLKKTDTGITSDVVFPDEGVYPLADTVYRLYKDKFMRAWSIGFIPIKTEDIVDEDEDKVAEQDMRRGKRIKKSELLEYSGCTVPSNPEALTNMLKKGINIDTLKKAGFIEIEEEEDLTKEVCPECGADIADDDNPEYSSCSKCDWDESDMDEDNTTVLVLINDIKIEETEEYIRIPAKGEEGKHKGHKIRWMTVSEKEGIKGIYCIDCKKIITFVFYKNKGWTLEKAKKWMTDHGKNIEKIVEGRTQMDSGIFDNTAWLKLRQSLEQYDKEGLEIEEKGVIPFKETPKAPEGEAWDAGKEVRQAEVSDLKIMCTWFDSENPDIKTAYKLPHHKAKGHAVVWRAVAAAMGALLGARGGVAVPAGDKKGIYGHLVKHYKQFDKEPPEFKDYSEAELKELFPEEDKLKEIGLFDINEIYDTIKENKELKLKVDELNKSIKELELKAGAVLNAKNKQDLKNAQKLNQEADALIQLVLDSAKPAEEDSLEIEDEKDSKSDDLVIELEDSKGDDIVIDKGIDEVKLEEIVEKTFKESNKSVKEHFNKKLNYIIGRIE